MNRSSHHRRFSRSRSAQRAINRSILELLEPRQLFSVIVDGVTYNTNATSGLPILNSRSNGAGLQLYLDFDGGTDFGGTAAAPFDLDGSPSTFNNQEETSIIHSWRNVVSFYSPFNVNVTTVQPPTGGSNPVFAWLMISPTVGGVALVNYINNTSSTGDTSAGEMDGQRWTEAAHEIGHTLGLGHQSFFDLYGTDVADYNSGFGPRDVPIMGVDFAGPVARWFNGRPSSGDGAAIQDDMAIIANRIAQVVGGDGYMPDDFGGTIGTAQAIPASGMITGDIERISDTDVYSFTSIGGTYEIGASPVDSSNVVPKVELLDSSGNIVYAKQDENYRNSGNGRNNADEFTTPLPAGNYYVRVSGDGDYGDQGSYLVTAAPTITGWNTNDVGADQLQRGGTAAYNPSTNTLVQIGAGNDIWSTGDQFRYTNNILTSTTGSIVARIDGLYNTDFNAKAGLVIRQSLDSNSKSVYIGLKPTGILEVVARDNVGSSAYNATVNGMPAGPWVRLDRNNGIITYYSSTDGVNWVSAGSINTSMTGSVYIGLATTSHQEKIVTQANFSNISFSGTLGTAAPTYNGLSAPGNLTVTPATGANQSVVLNWADVAGETGYAIDRSVDGVTYSQIATVAANVLTYTDPLTYGSMRYFYRVSALNGATRSIPSAAVSVVNKPSAPTLPNSSYSPPFITNGTTALFINWADVTGDNGYKIERSANGGTTYTTLTTTAANVIAYNDSGLTADTAYIYRITPITSIGDSIGTPLLLNARTRAAAVSNFVFTAKNSNSMSMTWTAPGAGVNNVTIQKSTDGSNWSNAVTLAATVTTWTDTSVTPMGEYYYRIFSTNSGVNSVYSTIFAASPPVSTGLLPGWTSQDIGNYGGTGAAQLSGGTYTVLASGSDIWDNGDGIRLTGTAVTGDATIIAKVTSIENTDGWAKAGVMFRTDATGGSGEVAMIVSAGNGLQMIYRTGQGAGPNSAGQLGGSAAVWVRLTRAGNTFTGYSSTDGITWSTVGTVNMAMPTLTIGGIAVSAHNNSQLNKATFTNVTIGLPTVATAAAANPSPVTGTATNLTVLGAHPTGESNLTYTWVATTIPAGATTPTITVNGTNAAKNTVARFTSAGSYTFTVTITDQFGQTITSAVIVTVNATMTSSVLTSSKLSPSPVNLTAGQTKQFTAVALDQFGVPMANQPTFTYSVQSGAGSINSTGLYTAPTSAGTLATILATTGSITATATVGVVNLPWTSVDIGSPGVAGIAYDTATATVLTGSGSDIWTDTDQFHFDYQTLTGDQTIYARVTVPTLNTDGSNSFAAKAGLMFRDSTAPNASFVQLVFTNGIGIQLLYRDGTGVAAAQAGASIGFTGALYLKLVRTGTTYTGSYSSDGNTWTAVSSHSNTWINNTSLAGLVACSHDNTKLAQVTFTNVGFGSLAVVSAAAATPNPVTGTTTNLSVLGSDPNGETNLTYTWSYTSTPVNAIAPTFSINGTNAAKSTVATFYQAGTYVFTVTVKNAANATVTSSVNVVVSQKLTSFAVTPNAPAIITGSQQQFSASGLDQFGTAMSSGTITWSVTAGGGNIDTTGKLAAGSTGGNFTVTATSGTASGNTTVMIVPTVYNDTGSNDTYTLRVNPANSLQDQIVANGFTYTIAASALPSLAFNGGAGDDSLTVDYANGNPLLSGGVLFSGGAIGTVGNALYIKGQSTGGLSFSVYNTQVVYNGTFGYGLFYSGTNLAQFDLNGSGNTITQSVQPTAAAVYNFGAGANALNINAGTYNFAGDPQSPNGALLTVNANAAVTFAAPTAGSGFKPYRLAALNLGSSGSATLTDAANLSDQTILSLGSLSMSNTSILNLNANALMVHNGDAASIASLLTVGQNQPGSFWAGTGITSYTARDNASPLMTLAELSNTTGAAVVYSTFDGQPAVQSDVLVRYTLLGDADLNGIVNGNDYTQIDNGFNIPSSGWSNGDFNYDGKIDGSDYSLIDNAFNRQAGGLAAPASIVAAPSAISKTSQTFFAASPSSEVFETTKVKNIASSIFAEKTIVDC